MRTFSTLLLVWALVLLTITTIISATDAYTQLCDDCLEAARFAIVPPYCRKIEIPADHGPLTEEKKSCLCPIVYSDTWPLQCVKPGFCTDQNVNEQMTLIKSLGGPDCPNAVAPATTTDKPSSSATGALPASTNAATRFGFSSRVAVSAFGAVLAALL